MESERMKSEERDRMLGRKTPESTDRGQQSGRKLSEDQRSTVSTESIASHQIVTPPDGGWGWVVVVGAFMCSIIIDGVTNAFGIFYVKFLEYFNSSPALTALSGSLICGCYLAFGAITGPLVTRFGCRPVAFVGGLVTSAALVLCTFSPNIETFMLTYGVIAGVGLGLVYVPAVLIVNFYFDKKRGIASGIVTSGSGVGVVAIAKLSEVMLEEYGWKGAHMILAGVALNLCVCAAVFRPLKAKVIPEVDLWEVVSQEALSLAPPCDGVVTSAVPSQTGPYSPLLQRQTQALANCVQYTQYISSPVVQQTDKNQYLQLFGTKPCMYGVPVNGQPGCRSTEWLNRISGAELGPGRLSSSMFTVNTSAAHHPSSSLPKKPVKKIEMSPLVRKDIFFSGSVMSLEAFRSQPDMKHYIASITVDEEPVALESSVDPSTKSCSTGLCANMDISLFKSAVFNIFCVSSMLIQVAGFIPPFYMGKYALSVGLDLDGGVVATFLACMGFSCILGRLLSGAVASWKPSQSMNIMAASLVISGVVCAAFCLCQTFIQICAVASLFGFFIGFFPPLQPLLLVRYLGLEKLSASFGLCTGLKGVATMAGPPLAGVLLESTGSYVAPFCFGGLCLVAAGLLSWVIPCVDRRPPAGVSLSLEVASVGSGSQTEESNVDSDEERSRKGSLSGGLDVA